MRTKFHVFSVTLIVGLVAATASAQQSYPTQLAFNPPPGVGDSIMTVGCDEACDAACDGACDAGCDACGCDTCCCDFFGTHRTGIYAEFLYLRPRDAEITYGAPINGPAVAPPAVPIQTGRMGVADPDYSTGYRIGFNYCLDECSSLHIGYTYFDSSSNDIIQATAPEVIQPMLLHPSSGNAATNALQATANYDIDFEFIDANYRASLHRTNCSSINYSVGVRYANMVQDFRAIYTLAGTDETIATAVNFDGLGLRLGLDGERKTKRGLLVYGKTNVSFLAGDFRGRYAQGSNFDASIVDARWRAGRLVSILDLEVGAGWSSKCDRVRATLGYHLAGWYNTVQTDEFVQAVRSNNFVGLSDRISFDGLAARIEFRR